MSFIKSYYKKRAGFLYKKSEMYSDKGEKLLYNGLMKMCFLIPDFCFLIILFLNIFITEISQSFNFINYSRERERDIERNSENIYNIKSREIFLNIVINCFMLEFIYDIICGITSLFYNNIKMLYQALIYDEQILPI